MSVTFCCLTAMHTATKGALHCKIHIDIVSRHLTKVLSFYSWEDSLQLSSVTMTLFLKRVVNLYKKKIYFLLCCDHEQRNSIYVNFTGVEAEI